LSGLSLSDDIRIYKNLSEVELPAETPIVLIFFETGCHVCFESVLKLRLFRDECSDFFLTGITNDSYKQVRKFAKMYYFLDPIICDLKREIFRKCKVRQTPVIKVYGDKRLKECLATIIFTPQMVDDFKKWYFENLSVFKKIPEV
jgi:peroxiredoxin